MSEWIDWKWSAEKPYPETLGTKVYIKTGDGFDDTACSKPLSVGYWHDDGGEQSNWYQCAGPNDIVAYKVVRS